MNVTLYIKPECLESRIKQIEAGEEAMFAGMKEPEVSGYVSVTFESLYYSFKSGLGAYILVKEKNPRKPERL